VQPETRYAKSGDLNIAYQVVGEGPLDLIYVPGWISNVELMWEEPAHAHVVGRLARFSRLILFDKRGTGLSDPVPLDSLPTLEERMDDVRAVLDAVGCERAALFGFSEGGLMSVLFAATYPNRITALVLYGTFAKRIWSPDYPWAPTPEARRREIEELERNWADKMDLDQLAPSEDEAFKQRLAKYFRRSASPGAAVALLRMNTQIDVRDVLPTIQAPTLVVHRTDDRDVNVEEGRWIAARIPGAKYVELPGDNHTLWAGDTDAIVDEIEEFLTGVRRGPEPDRVLATVLFTDVVGRPSGRPSWATAAGASSWSGITQRFGASSSAFRGARSTRQVTASWPPSTGLPGRSAAPGRSATRSASSDYTSAPACTRASASWSARRSPASRFTRALVSRRRRGPARCSSRKRSRISSPARGSSSRTAASTS
jgi:pimeloyl-ACP methyl ester carboxylesterase